MPSLDDYVEAFEQARLSGEPVRLGSFLPPEHDPLYRPVLRELVRIDLELGWESHAPRTLEEYRSEFPSLFNDPDSLQEIAFEEYRLRRHAGQSPHPEEYARRYGIRTDGWPAPVQEDDEPSIRLDAAARSFQAVRLGPAGQSNTWRPPNRGHSLLPELFKEIQHRDPALADSLARGLVALPEPGQELGGFYLIAELGRGAFARVFLARQSGLADRPVALKVSPDVGVEPQLLARLQHTHIVPIHSVHSHGTVRAVCMPYCGPTTLGDVVRDLQANGLPATGAGLLRPLEQKPRPVAAPRAEPGGQVLRKAVGGRPYAEAVLWVGGCLAEALQHAHDRGVLHRDVKPSNVLLSDEGVPMLLDFNVAEDVQTRDPAAALVGGTLPYMAPEQMRAFRTGQDLTDPRSDVYSLGIVLYELLTGRFPFPPVYGTDDLERTVDRLLEERQGPAPCPRRVVPGLSPAIASVVRHCLEPDPARRYPSAAALREDVDRHLADLPLKHAPEPSLAERAGKWWRRSPRTRAGLLAAAAVLLLAVAGVSAYAASEMRTAADARRRHERFIRAFHSAQFLLATRPESARQREEGEEHARAALAAFDGPGRTALRALPPAARERVTAETGELWLLLARARLATGRADEALDLNGRALAHFGDGAPSAVWSQRAAILDELGETKQAAEARQRERAARVDPVMLARERTSEANYREALALLGPVMARSPGAYWALFLQGLSFEGLRQDGDAAAAYQACTALEPDFHGPFVNRGLIHLRRRRFRLAKEDFDRVIELAANRPETYLDRALAREGLGDYKGAEADLREALAKGITATRVHFLRARVLARAGDRAGAERARAEGLKATPTDDLSWIARALVRRGSDPKAALADMEEALKRSPHSRQALMGKANILAEHLHDQEAARRVLEKVLKLYPDHAPALAGQAVVLARLGHRQRAHELIRAALDRDPSPEVRYQAGCVYALTSQKEPADAERSLAALRLAVVERYGLEFLHRDDDLAAVRKRPQFADLVKLAAMLRR